MRSLSLLLLLLLAAAALSLAAAFEYDLERSAFGTWDAADEVAFLELDAEPAASAASAAALTPFPPSSPFATLHSHLTWDQAALHCNSTDKSLTLCPASALCPGGQPLGGTQPTRTLVPVADADGKTTNRWVSLGSDRTCEVVDGGKWGSTPESRLFKGRVACCETKSGGSVRSAQLSRWEGFLLKRSDLSSVWMVERGVRRGVPSAKAFDAMGFHWERVRVLPAEQIDAVPLGPNLPDVSNRAPNSALYRHPILRLHHQGGNPFEAYEGYLIKKSESAIICMVEHVSKRCLPDSDTFEALGFEYRLVQLVPSSLYDMFPLGAPFESRVGAAPNSEPFVHALLGADHYGTASLCSTQVDDAAMVEHAVRRVMQREPTKAERESLLAKLRERRQVPDVLLSLTTSLEYQQRFVWPGLAQAVYRAVLERLPSAEEQRGVVDFLTRAVESRDPTKTIKSLVASLALAELHQSQFITPGPARTPEQAVRNLYRHLLGREPENESVLKGHASHAAQSGWKALTQLFLDSEEYRQTAGAWGVPGQPLAYADAVKQVWKALLNEEPTRWTNAQLTTECGGDLRKHGWSAYVDELLKRREYVAENGSGGFMDERDRIITLRSEQSATAAQKSSKKL